VTSPALSAVNDSILAELRAIVGDGLSTSVSVLEQHGRDESYHPPSPPDVVVYPKTTDEVSRIAAACARARVPLIPFGTGTSLEGNVAALRGGVCVDLTQMNAILSINVDDLDATVEAGVTRNQLNDRLRDYGVFFAVDPGADASLGGMTATRASGTSAVRYGTMRENVLSLTVVLADGRVIRTARRARKSSAGYDLTRLFVGSEGTLGLITEVTVRLFGVPEAISSAVCSFPSIEEAVQSVIQTIQLGIPVARIELLDDLQMDAVNRYSDLDYTVAPTLFYEFHGTEASVAEQSQLAQSVASEFGGQEFRWATRQDERNKLWRARHDAYYAALALRPGSRGFVTDVCVPISRLAECITETKKDLESATIPVCLVGHVGDGNFHLVFMVDPENASELAEVEQLNERMVLRSLAMDGTCTGEHGVGYGKMKFLEAEHGDALDVMRALKRALDPLGIMNPGKIVSPDDQSVVAAPNDHLTS
jgi:D-lactate dehydrogenase (cytochrome)